MDLASLAQQYPSSESSDVEDAPREDEVAKRAEKKEDTVMQEPGNEELKRKRSNYMSNEVSPPPPPSFDDRKTWVSLSAAYQKKFEPPPQKRIKHNSPEAAAHFLPPQVQTRRSNISTEDLGAFGYKGDKQ